MRALKQRLKELDHHTFEDLCFHILKERFPGLGIRHVEGHAGDEGIDIFEGRLKGDPCIWQCKHFPNGVRKSQKDQVRKSLRIALKHSKPRLWVLCIPVDLDAKAHRWFQRFQASCKDKVAIGLFQGSDILHELIHRKTIRELFFPDILLDNLQELKGLLTKTGEYTTEELEKVTSENVGEYIQRLVDKDPRFIYRITFHPDTSSQEREDTRGTSTPDESVLSVTDGYKTLNLIPRDIEALKLDPPTVHLQIKGPAIQKFQEALRTGTEAEFGPDEIGEMRSTLDFLLPEEFRLSKFVMGPSINTKKQRFFLRATLRSEIDTVTYDVVEFGIARQGTKECELVTRDDVLPFQMSIVLSTRGAGRFSSSASWSSWEGKEVRVVRKAIKAIRLLERGGSLELFDVKQDRMLLQGKFAGKNEKVVSEEFETLLDEIGEVAEAFGAEIRLTTEFAKTDQYNLGFLLTVARKGKVVVPAETFSVTFDRDENYAETFADMAKKVNRFRFELPAYVPRPTLFGTEIDTGPCTYYIPKTRMINPEDTVKAYLSAKNGEGVHVKFKVLEPLELIFAKFASKLNKS